MLACHAGDIADAKTLLLWISKLGEHKRHCILLAVDAGTPFDKVIELRELSEGMFREVRVTTNGTSTIGWPVGSNSLFKAAATYVQEHWPEPFIFVEPDCVPLKAGWLDEIEKEWSERLVGKLFMGQIYDCIQPFMPSRLMSGIAVYAPEGISLLPFLKDTPRAWDVDGAEIMVERGMHTAKIRHVWGQQNLPPIFVARKDAHSPVNAMTLEDIPQEAVLFHRCKGTSLIKLLERKLFPQEFREKICVAFPVYAGDIGLAILHAKWLQRMGKRHEHRAVICHDPSCPVTLLNQFEQLLRASFSVVESYVYNRPPIPTYPAVANFAFQSVAHRMAMGRSPWFWFEADAIALKPDWIEQLQVEYDNCGRSWMGNIVPHLDHIQGTAVYPADAALRMPRAMSCGSEHAFDMAAREDGLHDRHDATRLLFCVWTVMADGSPSPVGGGNLPVDLTVEWARKHVPPSSVFIHRVKNDTLLKGLLAGERL